MHKLLKHQLKKIDTTVDEKFLSLVNQAYEDADADRALLEHSLGVSSEEMRELYESLKKSSTKKLNASEERYEHLVYELRDHYFFYAYDKHLNLTYLSDSFYNILGYTKEEAINTKIADYLTSDTMNADMLKQANFMLEGNKIAPHIVSMRHKDGSTRYIEIDSYHSIDKVEGIARDITTSYQNQQKINYISTHDMLTGINNRHSLYSKLEYIIANASRNKKSFALLYIDLDDFKIVNDTLGHDIGDMLLQEVTQKVKKEIRKNDIFARIGGDEFVLVLTDVRKDFVEKFAKKVLQSLASDFILHEHTIQISISIGISIFPKDGDDVDSLLKNADLAMYDTKKNGKNNFSFF